VSLKPFGFFWMRIVSASEILWKIVRRL